MQPDQTTPEGSPEPKLWAIFVPGPDTLWAMPSKEAADESAARHNKAIKQAKLAERYEMPDESVEVRVVEWPYDAKAHANDLKNQEGTTMSSNQIDVPDNLAAAVTEDAEEKAKFNIDARALPVLALFTTVYQGPVQAEYAAECATSNILCMPHPDGDGILLVATDRRAMAAIWHDPDGMVFRNELIPVPEKSELEKIMMLCRGGNFKRIRYTISEGQHSVKYGADGFSVQQDDALKAMPGPEIFPDVLKVFPAENMLVNGLHGRVTTKTLRRFSKAVKLALQATGRLHTLGSIAFWSAGSSGLGRIVARCHAAPNLLMITTVMAEEMNLTSYVSGFRTMFPEVPPEK